MKSRDYNGELPYWSARSSMHPTLLTLIVSPLPLEDPYRRARQCRGARPKALRQEHASILQIGRASGVSTGIAAIQDGQLAANVACLLAS